MNDITQVVQKVRQAPWRVQRQWIGLFLLALVLVAMVAGIYLNITVRATLAGRESITLRNTIANNQRVNSDLETQLAGLTSVAAMQQRAEALGFLSVDPEEITYVVVPGYVRPAGVDLSTPGGTGPAVPVILPEYTESWFDYLLAQQSDTASSGGQP
jgi:hypothetical protein